VSDAGPARLVRLNTTVFSKLTSTILLLKEKNDPTTD